MILRDQHGELTVPFGTDFEYKGALLTVVCPAAEPIGGQRAIWCRLQKGALELGTQRFEIGEDGRRPVVPFATDLVAHQVRLMRLGGLQIVPPAVEPAGDTAAKDNAHKDKIHAAQTGLFD